MVDKYVAVGEETTMKKWQGTGILIALMEHMQGTAAQKLSLFEKLKGAGMLACDDAAELEETEEMLRSFVAAEKLSGRGRSVETRPETDPGSRRSVRCTVTTITFMCG